MTIKLRPDGWWVVDAAGVACAGPFRTLREVEDWFDWRDPPPPKRQS